MTDKTTKLPAYVSPGTYWNFIDSLRKTGLPGRVDKSVPFLSSKAGVIQGQLLSSLQFLDLISEKGIPTQKFHNLIEKQDPDELKRVKQEILKSAYPFLFGDFSLENATTNLVAEAFKTHAKVSAGSMIFRCVSFFVAFAKKSGLKVSPHINAADLRPKKDRGQGQSKEMDDVREEDFIEENPAGTTLPKSGGTRIKQLKSWQELLLEKFPAFDPSWPPEIQKQWFDAFGRLMNNKPE